MTASANQTKRGHEEPLCCQFSIFLANRVGQLQELLEEFAQQEVDVLGMSVVDSTDWAVVRTVFSDPNKARAILERREFPFTVSHVLLVVMPSSETLRDVCDILLRAELNIHFAYPLVYRVENQPIMVLHVDDHILAAHALTRRGYELVGEEDLADPT